MVYYVKKRWSTAKKARVGDYTYDSGFEGQYAQELIFRKVAGEIKDWDRQYQIRLICNGFDIGGYKCDFIIYHHDKSIELVECKGYAFPDWKWRWKVLESMVATEPKRYFGYDDVKMTVIQQRSGWKIPKGKRLLK